MDFFSAMLLIVWTASVQPGERALNKTFAQRLGGDSEVSHPYFIDGKRYFIVVDIETKDYVIEAGLDRRSSLDSVQQVMFAAIIARKKPKIIIYDSDGIEGPYEYRIRMVAHRLGIAYERINIAQLTTSSFSSIPATFSRHLHVIPATSPRHLHDISATSPRHPRDRLVCQRGSSKK